MAKEREKLDWIEIDQDDLPEDVAEVVKEAKAADKHASELWAKAGDMVKPVFEPECPDGHKVKFGRKWGKWSVAYAPESTGSGTSAKLSIKAAMAALAKSNRKSA